MIELSTSTEIIKLLVDKIEKKRKKSKITQKNLAKKSGMSYGAYREFIDNSSISLASFISLFHVLGLFSELKTLVENKEVKSIAQMKEEDRINKRV